MSIIAENVDIVSTVRWQNDCVNGRSHNKRFGARGAVVPRKQLCGIERLSPARTFVEAPA